MSKATVEPLRMRRLRNDNRPPARGPAKLPNPVPALRQCQIRLARQVVFEAAFIELLLVKTSECRRQTTKRPDQLELRSNDRNDEAESGFPREFEPILGSNMLNEGTTKK